MSGPEPSMFDADTAVRRAGDAWAGDLHPRWNVGGRPNGGYLLAVAARAMMSETGRRDPVTVTAHYLAPPSAGPVDVVAGVVKSGRTFATASGSLLQEGRERVRLLGAFGDLDSNRGPTRVSGSPPQIAPPDECIGLDEVNRRAGREVPEVMNRFDMRFEDGPRAERASTDPLEVTGWIRFGDGSDASTLSLLLLADAFPPTALGGVAAGWVPTVELTVHVRAKPSPGWLLGTFRTRFLVDGLLEEDGELWDSSGRLVALSRQLAMVLTR